MTKIYLVCREVYKGYTAHDTLVVGVFTNKKKANSLVRWYNAKDVKDRNSYPRMYEKYNPRNFVNEKFIENFDFEKAAMELEIENLPF